MEAAPALWPKIVTLSGSPPKNRMFSFTHCRARIWSFDPTLPGITSSPVDKYPENVSNIYYVNWRFKYLSSHKR